MVLIRYPGILAALTLGALLLSLAAAAHPLFMSGMSSRLLRSEIGAPLVGRYGAGITYKSKNVPLRVRAPGGGDRLYEARAETFAALVAANGYLRPPEETILGPEISAVDPDRPHRIRAARLFAGDRVLEHIEVVEGHRGPGVWIPDLIARGLRLGPGDPITLTYAGHEPLTLQVDGVYRTLASQPPTGYWSPWYADIYPTSPGGCRLDCPIPPQFILLDRTALLGLASRSARGQDPVSVAWQAPLRGDVELTMDDAAEMRGLFHQARADASDASTRTGRVLGCCPPADYYLGRPDVEFSSRIDQIVGIVDQRVVSLVGPGQVLRIAGLAVAMAVLASAGMFSVNGRRVEFRLLAARGTGPAGVGVKTAIESILPSLVGGAAGLGLAFLLVRLVASGAPVAPGSNRAGTAAAVLAVGASVASLGIVAGIGSLRHGGHRPGRLTGLARVPWELAVLSVAVLAWSRLPSGVGSSQVALDVRPPSPLLLIFPIAVIAGLSGLGARLFRKGYRSLRSRGAGRRSSPYLAIRRLAGAPALSTLLVAAAGLCLGVFVQGQALVDSLRLTVGAKAKVFVGSDVQAWVGPDTALPDLALPVTRAVRVRQAGEARPTGETFDLVAVDPATVAEAAYWNEGFADPSLAELAARLESPAAASVPVVIAGADGFDPSALVISQQPFRVEVVAHADAFPGMLSRRPLVVLDAAALNEVYEGRSNPLTGGQASAELWIRGDAAEARRALAESGTPAFQVTTARGVQDLPRVATIIDTFGLLQILGVVSAILVVAALVMYLQARQRSQIVSRGLSIRMGMRARNHLWALALEVGSMLLTAWALGVSLGIVAAALLLRRLDPLPVVPPDPLFAAPLWSGALLLAALVALSLVGAWLTARAAANVRLGEAMRVAE